MINIKSKSIISVLSVFLLLITFCGNCNAATIGELLTRIACVPELNFFSLDNVGMVIEYDSGDQDIIEGKDKKVDLGKSYGLLNSASNSPNPRKCILKDRVVSYQITCRSRGIYTNYCTDRNIKIWVGSNLYFDIDDLDNKLTIDNIDYKYNGGKAEAFHVEGRIWSKGRDRCLFQERFSVPKNKIFNKITHKEEFTKFPLNADYFVNDHLCIYNYFNEKD